MALTSSFNLQSKTQEQLKGLYAEIFNKLADKNVNHNERRKLHAMMYQLMRELPSFP